MKDIALKTIDAPALQGTVMTPMDMLSHAVQRGDGIEVLEKLMALQDRWEATQARKAFNEAFASFKAEAIVVVRNRKVSDGPLKGKRYAELVSFVEAVTPALSKNDLSASWDITRDEKDWIEVTCIIEHVLGHSKRVSLGGPPDVGGAKNPIQARASTVTYLERHTIKAACGLAEQGDDDDGRAPQPTARISDEQQARLVSLADEVGADKQKFCKYLKVASFADILAKDYAHATTLLEAKRTPK